MTPHLIARRVVHGIPVYAGYVDASSALKDAGTVITLGNFDGVHHGHRKIIEETLARRGSRLAGAYTFRPHPQIALRPERALPLLTTYDEKLELLAQTGIDFIVEEPFSREFSSQSAPDFFEHVLKGLLGAQAVVVGHDFRFGKEREGSLEGLRALSSRTGVELTIVPAFAMDEQVLSSSAIRAALERGEVRRAAEWLGRPFSYSGTVVQGQSRGRGLGFPTANLRLPEAPALLALPLGVYATRSQVGGQEIKSVTNIGLRPTFYPGAAATRDAIWIETHLLDFSGNLYGETLCVKFVERLRAERRFANVEELRQQIAADILKARQIL